MNFTLEWQTVLSFTLTAIIGFLIPYVNFRMQRRFDRFFELKAKLEEERQKHTKKIVDDLIEKIDNFLNRNEKDHSEFFKRTDALGNRVIAIETTHKIKGCDSLKRRASDAS